MIKFVSLALLTGCTYASIYAQETAWVDTFSNINRNVYVYGSVPAPPDTIKIFSASKQTSTDDPFSENNTRDKTLSQLQLNEIAPLVNRQNLPACLPIGQNYRDISGIMIKNGVFIKQPEWVLLAKSLSNGTQIYFCTTAENADIIDQLFNYHCCGPKSIYQTGTLISIAQQKRTNNSITFKTLNHLSPKVHSQFGHQGRSGEKVWNSFSSKNNIIAGYEMESIIGQNNILIDCHLDFSIRLPDPSIRIAQTTNFTANTQKPFILNCGTHGKRDFFLIIHSKILDIHNHQPRTRFAEIKKIDGIYTMRTQKTKIPHKPSSSYLKRQYHVDPQFLIKIREKVDYYKSHDPDDPFSEKPTVRAQNAPSPPTRIQQFPYPTEHNPKDKIFDITPHLHFIGFSFFAEECVHFNQTKYQLTTYGDVSLQHRITNCLESMLETPRQIRFKASIASVDKKGWNHIQWTPDLINQSNPEYITQYTATSRSGMKGTSGKKHYTIKDPKTKKVIDRYTYDLEFEPIISENNETIDVRLSLRTKPLHKNGFSLEKDTGLSIQDGKPKIIELGHPNSNTRTHLLILNADIITPDGSFYRDRFQPIK